MTERLQPGHPLSRGKSIRKVLFRSTSSVTVAAQYADRCFQNNTGPLNPHPTLFNPALQEALLSRDSNGAGAPEQNRRMLFAARERNAPRAPCFRVFIPQGGSYFCSALISAGISKRFGGTGAFRSTFSRWISNCCPATFCTILVGIVRSPSFL